MKLILLTNIGKCGTLFVQRLFDAHPLIITLPCAFNYYYVRNKLLSANDDLEIFMNKLLDFTSLKEVLHFVDREKYLKRVRDYLPNDFDIQKDRKELLEAIHLAYHHLMGGNRKATHILLNAINVSSLDLINEDYVDHKHIFLIRNPKNSFASYLSSDHSNDPKFKFQFLKNSLRNALYIQTFYHKKPDQVIFLKVEDLNEDLHSSIKNLCRWLNINFSDALLIESVNGKPFSEHPVKLEDRKSSAKIRNTRWLHSLTPNEIILIEYLHNEIIEKYYEFSSSKLYRNRLVATAISFMPDIKLCKVRELHANISSVLSPKQWFLNGLNWYKLIRVVKSKAQFMHRVSN